VATNAEISILMYISTVVCSSTGFASGGAESDEFNFYR
jgi:hypothetical protein